MVITCKKCGEKYVSVVLLRMARDTRQAGEMVEEMTKGTIEDCVKCREVDEKKGRYF